MGSAYTALALMITRTGVFVASGWILSTVSTLLTVAAAEGLAAAADALAAAADDGLAAATDGLAAGEEAGTVDDGGAAAPPQAASQRLNDRITGRPRHRLIRFMARTVHQAPLLV